MACTHPRGKFDCRFFDNLEIAMLGATGEFDPQDEQMKLGVYCNFTFREDLDLDPMDVSHQADAALEQFAGEIEKDILFGWVADG